jgi:3-hydroxybutyrate dehydrogenase
LEEFPFTEWKKMLAIHLDGASLTTKACLKHMYAAGSGSIIYIGSIHSKEASMLKAPYVTAKHGLIGLAKVVAKEGAKHGVRQRVLSGICADTPCRHADPGAGQTTRHQRAGRDQDRDAA